MELGEFAQAHPAATIMKNRLAIDVEGLAADVPAFEFRPTHAGSDAFDYQRSFQLGDCADDHDDGSAECATGIDIFAERNELDAEPTQFIEDFQIVSNRAGDAIARPDDNDIELAAASVDQELIQAGPLRPGAADAVSVFVDDLEAALLSKREQVVALPGGTTAGGSASAHRQESEYGRLPAAFSARAADLKTGRPAFFHHRLGSRTGSSCTTEPRNLNEAFGSLSVPSSGPGVAVASLSCLVARRSLANLRRHSTQWPLCISSICEI